MKKVLFGIGIAIFLASIVGLYLVYFHTPPIISSVPHLITSLTEKPLEKYSITKLSATPFAPSAIQIGEIISKEDKFISYKFYYIVDGKKVSGMLNVPIKPGSYPVIVLFRGFVPQETYMTGIGTMRAAEYFANNGFITMAPDFLGYGESDNPSVDIFEARFQTYTTAAMLLSSVKNLNTALQTASISSTMIPDKIGIWGHSNGGQIALTTLEITGVTYPTVLWAPVSKPFPYSILYYTDEADDNGKALRKELAKFEETYDVENYSLTNYLNQINAPIQLNQGLNDPEVPVEWSNELVDKFKKMDKTVEYFTYPNADHNLMPAGWNPAVIHALAFYNHYLASETP